MKRRMIVAVACAGAIVCGFAAPAFAHVTIDPPSVPQGQHVEALVPGTRRARAGHDTEVQIFFPTGADAIPGSDGRGQAGLEVHDHEADSSRSRSPPTTAPSTKS